MLSEYNKRSLDLKFLKMEFLVLIQVVLVHVVYETIYMNIIHKGKLILYKNELMILL